VSADPRRAVAPDPLFLRGSALRDAAGLVHDVADRLEAAAAPALSALGLGWPHFRALTLIAARPGLTVAAAAAALAVTKQSLAPVLNTLEAQALIRREADARDRRARRLHLTAAGEDARRRIAEPQAVLLAQAFRAAGPEAVEGFRAVLNALPGDAR